MYHLQIQLLYENDDVSLIDEIHQYELLSQFDDELDDEITNEVDDAIIIDVIDEADEVEFVVLCTNDDTEQFSNERDDDVDDICRDDEVDDFDEADELEVLVDDELDDYDLLAI